MTNPTTRAGLCNFFAVLVGLFCLRVTDGFMVNSSHRSSFREGLSPVSLSSTHDEQIESYSETIPSTNELTRRRAGRLAFQSLSTGVLAWGSFRQLALAEDGSASTDFIVGKVVLPTGMDSPGGVDNGTETPTTKPALYITARPNRPDNVPRAILDGSRGKPPPVLAARYENPGFPFEFQLSDKDLTPEGAGIENNGSSSGTFWWSTDDLVVSARWDSDGIAATRSPEDLVGRNVWKRDETTGSFVLPLQGRGSFGKFATKKS